jgi:predicted RNase H-like HicB family nuclease
MGKRASPWPRRSSSRPNPDAGVWFVESSDLPGLNLESKTLDGLRERLRGAVTDLLEAAGRKDELDVPIELIAHGFIPPRPR